MADPCHRAACLFQGTLTHLQPLLKLEW
jgi:hypothetical protein